MGTRRGLDIMEKKLNLLSLTGIEDKFLQRPVHIYPDNQPLL
jgi:hypothetical protein